MDQQKNKWNAFYFNQTNNLSDPWLDNYKDYFEGAWKILDLGCGNGSNIPFLLSTGAEITAVDFSENAISDVRKKWNITALVHDIRQPLPFLDNSFDMILADLSLHYFSMNKTNKIMNELYRIIMNKGILVGRVNSIDDYNHGAGNGKEIEPNYYEKDGNRKRFFDREMIDTFFDDKFILNSAIENSTYKYDQKKKLWEFVSIKLT